MRSQHLYWKTAGLTILGLAAAGVLAGIFHRNSLSATTIIGRWEGYVLQPQTTAGATRLSRVPLVCDFRPDGTVRRGAGGSVDADYTVSDGLLIFSDIRSRHAPARPIVWHSSIVGDTLTIGTHDNLGGSPVAILKRVR